MSPNPTGPDEVKEHLNFIEKLVDGADSSDEYFEAMIRNQAVMISLLEGGGSNVPEVGSFGVPADTAGIAIQGASEGDYAEFLYKADGRTVIGDFEVESDINSGEVAKVTEDGSLQPKTNVDQGDLDFGNIATQSTGPNGFTYIDTEQNVEVAPGTTEVVIEESFSENVSLSMVGTNDETHTVYEYFVDDEPLISDPIPKPLGLYNNMFEFPVPIQVNNSFRVEVTRQNSAPGIAEYFSNAVLL